ncbi:MAG: rhodanese-like domain-containing protein [Vicingaceae bacterium]
MRISQLFFLLLAACGIRGQSFDQMVDNLIDKSIPLIQPNELDKERTTSSNLVILDARAREEYQVSHLEGALWVGYKDFDMNQLSLDPGSEIVVYCSVGYRSEKVAEQIEKAGYKNVKNLYGGIFNWVNNGYSVVDGNEVKTQKVHPYSNSWGKWLIKGEKAYE